MNKLARRGRDAAPRVVLDTNVTISALVFGGAPGEVLANAQRRMIRAVMSPELRDELIRVLGEKFHWSTQRLNALQDDLDEWVEWVEPETHVSIFRGRDEADNRVFEAAIAGQAEAIVTGDQQLLRLKRFREISILTPRAFLSSFEKRWAE